MLVQTLHQRCKLFTSLQIFCTSLNHSSQVDFEKDPGDGSSLSKDSTEMLFTDEKQVEKQQLAKEQEPPNSTLFEEVVENDIQWGRKTLQNFFLQVLVSFTTKSTERISS